MSQRHIRISKGDIIFSKLLLFSLDSLCILYHTNILYELSTNTGIHIKIIQITVVLVLNNILVSG